jgi:NHLM bacteriocin system ABC transporter peptidase/ATP-binding protein
MRPWAATRAAAQRAQAWLRGLRGPVRTPTILQMAAVECGAASLAMVLAHYGRWVPLEELRIACGVSRDGSKASNILKAARSFGMQAKGFKKEPAGLLDLPTPSIIHWNFNHYVVFEGFQGGYAIVNDPARGRRRYPRAEFGQSFTGVVLALTPDTQFARGGSPPRPLREIVYLLRRSWGAVGLVCAFSLMLVVPGLLIPGLAKLFVDKVLLQRLQDWLLPLCAIMVGAGALRALVVQMQQHYLLKLEGKLAALLSGRVMSAMMALPLSFFNQRYAGELATRVACADKVAALLSGEVATTCFNMIAVVVYAAAMAVFDPLLAAVALLVPICNFALLRLLRRRATELNRGIALDQGRMTGAAIGAIVGIETIKVSGSEGEAFSRWAGYHARAMSGQQALGLVNGIVGVAPALLSALGSGAVLIVGGYRVIDGALSIGSLLALQMLMASFVGPFNQLVALAEKAQQAAGDLNRINDLLNSKPPPLASLAVLDKPRLEGRVEFRNITFGYSPADEPLVRDFNLVLEPGMRVALVGGSGSGKSTIGKILCGLLEPWLGQVLVDGQPIETIPPALRAASLGYVDQDVFLFAGTIRDNLTLWDRTQPETALVEALKDAEIHAEVAVRPGALDSLVMEGGVNFSGGQRQRLEIARALVGNPSVLVLDEATAALDPVTEQRIDEGIRRRGCTCIIIAHRLSTVRDADQIVVLNRGKVVEQGTHPVLLEAGGTYAALFGGGAH